MTIAITSLQLHKILVITAAALLSSQGYVRADDSVRSAIAGWYQSSNGELPCYSNSTNDQLLYCEKKWAFKTNDENQMYTNYADGDGYHMETYPCDGNQEAADDDLVDVCVTEWAYKKRDEEHRKSSNGQILLLIPLIGIIITLSSKPCLDKYFQKDEDNLDQERIPYGLV